MPDLNPNNPESDSTNNFGQEENAKYELITAYIDNEITDESEKNEIKKLIESDNNFHNRYIFEKLTKESFSERIKRVETPVYLYKKIGEGIDNYIKQVSKISSVDQANPGYYSQQINTQKSRLKRNLIYSSAAFLFLIAIAFLFNNILKKNPELRDNDLVAVSRNIFDKVSSGQIKPSFQSSNARELTDTMNKHLDFKVFVPDVKDAVLVGGVCNEINGEKIAHIIHKKGNILIYTLEASKNDIMTNQDKIILCDEFKEHVKKGENWFPCSKDKSNTAVIWYKDNVICASISELGSQELTKILTNYK